MEGELSSVVKRRDLSDLHSGTTIEELPKELVTDIFSRAVSSSIEDFFNIKMRFGNESFLLYLLLGIYVNVNQPLI